jgi:hypothetical protein
VQMVDTVTATDDLLARFIQIWRKRRGSHCHARKRPTHERVANQRLRRISSKQRSLVRSNLSNSHVGVGNPHAHQNRDRSRSAGSRCWGLASTAIISLANLNRRGKHSTYELRAQAMRPSVAFSTLTSFPWVSKRWPRHKLGFSHKRPPDN